MPQRRHIAEDETAEERLRQSEARLRLAQEVAGVGTFEWDIRNNVNRWSPEIERLYGIPEGSFGGTYEDWAALVHPDDLAEAERSVQEALETGHFETEWRVLRPDGEVVWVLARAVVEIDAEGKPLRMIGANFDISARVRAEEHQRMLMAELDHRVKNVLAVVRAIARQSLAAIDVDAADSFSGRLSALARSHELISESHWRGASLKRLVADTIHPYRDVGDETVIIQGRDIQVTPKAAQGLSLVLQELVTNAAKHGALSSEEGRVEVKWSVQSGRDGPRLVLVWRESGGPPIEAPPERTGFGTALIEQTAEYELGGATELRFDPEGLVARLELTGTATIGRPLPAPRDGARVASGRGDAPAPDRLAGKRVMVAEDQLLIARQAAEILASAGCLVIGPAATLRHARELLQSEPLDAALLDVNLNGELVWPLAEELHERGVPVVFMTGYADAVRRPEALRAAPRLTKPIADADLLAALASVL